MCAVLQSFAPALYFRARTQIARTHAPGPAGYKFDSYPQYFYVNALEKQAALATRLGYTADATLYATAATGARSVYLGKFYNSTTACYGNCSDVEQIFGLSLGLQEDGSAEEKAAWDNALSWFGVSSNHHADSRVSHVCRVSHVWWPIMP